MRDCCPTCHRPLSTPKRPILVAPVNTAQMSDAELYAHYKKTDRIETLRFWIRNAVSMSPELRSGFEAFYASVQTITITPQAFEREFLNLRSTWRRERDAAERQALIDAGYVYDRQLSRFVAPDDVVIVPTVFEDESGQACPVCFAVQDCREDCPNRQDRMAGAA